MHHNHHRIGTQSLCPEALSCLAEAWPLCLQLLEGLSAPDEVTSGACLTCLARAAQPGAAHRLLRRLRCNERGLAAALAAHEATGGWREALALLGSSGLRADVVVYGALCASTASRGGVGVRFGASGSCCDSAKAWEPALALLHAACKAPVGWSTVLTNSAAPRLSAVFGALIQLRVTFVR